MDIIFTIVGILVGGSSVFTYQKVKTANAKNNSDKIIATAQKKSAEILAKANEKAIKITEEAKKDESDRRKELQKTENRLIERETVLDAKLDQINERSEKLEKRNESLRKQENELEDLKEQVLKIKEKQTNNLEEIAKLNRKEAEERLLAATEKSMKQDMINLVAKIQKNTQEDAEERAQTILVTAMERISSEVTADRTVTALKLPDDEMKGRIIGKEGRNIQAIQRATGVDVLVDDTPGMVVLSSFDPVRRQVARLSLELLMKDGRINPARIEEVVEKAQKEINKEINRAGEDAAREVGISGLPREMLRLLGELKFRTSYGQNVLKHSTEMANIAGLIAEEIGANVKIAKTAALFHDVGKAVTHKIEGKHAQIGAELAEKYGMDPRVVNAIAAHHDDVEATTPEAIIVKITDAMSASRPGVRNAAAENFMERMRELENVATSFDGIDKAYAISAGREIRIIVSPEKIDDLSAIKLARDIANKIESTMQYPGVIKVNIIRETRAIEYAK